MSYKALYRTHRPQTFSEVCGQEVIVKTLKNAIKSNKISHAYLFGGPRGTGKTTLARIFAKALNCSNVVDGEPCCQCDSCIEVANGTHPDIIEIDAASNNGVDEIREIREKVKFLPVGAKYKIYIIDEVHMLTTGAFNALLKTLEEPPKHAVFILATTEMHKIPATIISRCQCYEFKSLSINEISSNLKKICAEENIKITEEALLGISESCEGGMRDALSILDQAISFADEEITIDDVNEITGSLNEEKMIEIADALEKKDISLAIKCVNNLINDGKDANKIINALLELYKDILIYRNITNKNDAKKIYNKETFKQLVNTISDNSIFYYVDILSDIQSKIKFSTTPNVYLEISLVRIVNAGSDAIKLSMKLQELEKKLDGVEVVEGRGQVTNSVDNEKIVLIENKLNRVINQLSQMELPKLIQRVQTLEANSNDNHSVKDYSKEIEEIQEQLLIVKTNLNALQNNVDNQGEAHNEDLNKKIEELEEKVNTSSKTINKDVQFLIEQKIGEIDSIKNSLFEHKYTSNVDYDLVEIKDKIINIENKLFKYISSAVSEETVPVKRTKTKSGDALSLYEEDLFSLKDLQTSKQNADFDGLEKETTPFLEIVEEKRVEVPLEDHQNEDSSKEIPEQQETLVVDAIVDEPVDGKSFDEDSSKEESSTTHPDQQEINLFNSMLEDKVEVVNTKDGTLITKTNSQLYKRNVENNDINDVFAEERQQLDKHIEQFKEEIKGTDKKQYELDEYSAYDVRVIERILNQSRTPEARNDKARIMKIWNVMMNEPDPDTAHIAQMLHEGAITAVGNKEFILVYPDYVMCNQVMRMRFKKESLKFLYDLLGDSYNYIALPEEVWLNKRSEYTSQLYTGTKTIKLTPINDPKLSVLEDNREYVDKREKAINRVTEMFGKDIVTVEK